MTEERNKPIDDAVPPQLPEADADASDAAETPAVPPAAGDSPAAAEAAEAGARPAAEPEAAETAATEPQSSAAEVEPVGGGPEAAEESETSETPATEPKAAEESDTSETSGAEAAAAEEQAAEEPEAPKMEWYILKVQSNREDSIRDGLMRRVKIAGLEEYFGEVIVPTEKVTEFKGGKKRVTKRKLYPGYLVVQMEINEDTWFLVRETPGIGDFTGAAGRPTPMLEHEVQRILAKKEEKQDEVPKLKIGFNAGDRVKINEGTFENFEGEVHTIDETNGRVSVMINIFGRSTPVELEYWQIESV
ncbi:MAG: transcription termination/antitermination protein NusG [Planctomycetota bacterium]|nr:transcription termination/antitermination protein NusG [Planctomycetota bacterium]